MLKIGLFQQKRGFFAFFCWQLDLATESLHEDLHHPPRTVHLDFGLHDYVSEKSFQDQLIHYILVLNPDFAPASIKSVVSVTIRNLGSLS